MKTTEPANDEGWSDERLLVKRIWSRAYLDTEEKHIGLLKAYADQQVNKVLDEAINAIAKRKNEIDPNEYGHTYRSITYGMSMDVLESLKIKQP